MTDIFTVFTEVYQALEQYVQSTGIAPHQIALPPVLYSQLMEIQAEQALLTGSEFPCYFYLPSDYGEISVIMDDQLGSNYIAID